MKTSPVSPIVLFFSISLHRSLKKAFLSPFAFLWIHLGISFSFFLCLSLLFSRQCVRPPQAATLPSGISFSSLIAVAKTSKTMLKNSGESGYPGLVPDLRGNVFSFSPLRITFAVGLSSGEGNGNPLQHSCLENPMDR